MILLQLLLAAALTASAALSPLEVSSRSPTSTVASDSLAIDSLLVRISRAPETVSYSGLQIRTTRHVGKSMQLRWQIFHWSPDRSVVVFLEPESLHNSTLVVKGDQMRYRGEEHVGKIFRHHGAKRLLQNGRIFKEIALLRENYRIETSPGPTFLKRPTILLRVSPKHAGRPSLTALVDVQTALLLKTTRLPATFPSDSLAEVSRFLNIFYGEPDSTIFVRAWSETEAVQKKSRKAQKYADLESLMANYKHAILVPARLPTGFSLLRIQSIQRRHKSYVHFLYGDGLTYVSLFQRKGAFRKSSKDEKPGQPKDTTRTFALVRGMKEGISYAIAGEIPVAELKAMEESLVPITKKRNPLRDSLMVVLVLLAFAVVVIVLLWATKRRENMHA